MFISDYIRLRCNLSNSKLTAETSTLHSNREAETSPATLVFVSFPARSELAFVVSQFLLRKPNIGWGRGRALGSRNLSAPVRVKELTKTQTNMFPFPPHPRNAAPSSVKLVNKRIFSLMPSASGV